MAHIKRKHIDSHWLTFVIRGVVCLLFGWITLFHSNNSFPTIISIIGLFLICLSIVESVNAFHRIKKKSGWFASILIVLVDLIAALLLVLTNSSEITFHLLVISFYTIFRGIIDIFLGLRIDDDMTDKFIWVIIGICGTIMGIVIFNSGSLNINSFIRFFGAYLSILGVSNLIYGIHNRAQKIEDHIARIESKKPKNSNILKKTSKKK